MDIRGYEERQLDACTFKPKKHSKLKQFLSVGCIFNRWHPDCWTTSSLPEGLSLRVQSEISMIHTIAPLQFEIQVKRAFSLRRTNCHWLSIGSLRSIVFQFIDHGDAIKSYLSDSLTNSRAIDRWIQCKQTKWMMGSLISRLLLQICWRMKPQD